MMKPRPRCASLMVSGTTSASSLTLISAGDGHRLAQQRLRGHPRRLRQQLDLVFEEPPQLLLTGHAPDVELTGRKRRGEGDGSIGHGEEHSSASNHRPLGGIVPDAGEG